MLPDYPEIKEKLKKKVTQRMERVKDSYIISPLKFPKIKIFEGDKILLVRSDGSVSEIKLQEMRVNIIQQRIQDVGNMSFSDLISKIDYAAKEMAKKESEFFYDRMEKSIEKIGNVIKSKKGGFQAEDFFCLIERIQWEFDNKDKPHFPTIVSGEKLRDSIVDFLAELKENIVYKERFDQIVEKKREEWRDRESNRKLVG